MALRRTPARVSVERLYLYAHAHERSFALHGDLKRPTQFERDCRWRAEMARM